MDSLSSPFPVKNYERIVLIRSDYRLFGALRLIVSHSYELRMPTNGHSINEKSSLCSARTLLMQKLKFKN